MKGSAACLTMALLFSGCAAEMQPQVRMMTPVDRSRFKDAQAAQTEFALVNPKCELKGLQAASAAPLPQRPSQQNVYIQTAPAAPSQLPQVRYAEAGSMADAYQVGQAIGTRKALTDTAYLACMADAGWIPSAAQRQ